MNGSPAKMGTISGTAGHSSALKMKAEADAASALKQMYSPEEMAKNKEAKATFDKNVSKPAPKTTTKKADPYAKAAKKDPKLGDYVKQRKGLKKGTPEYAKVQNKINAAYGVKKRYDEGPNTEGSGPVDKGFNKYMKKHTNITDKADKKQTKLKVKSNEVSENTDKKLGKLHKNQERKVHGRGSKEHLTAKKAHLQAKEADRQGERGGKKQGFFRKLSSKINKKRQDKIDKKLASKDSPADMHKKY